MNNPYADCAVAIAFVSTFDELPGDVDSNGLKYWEYVRASGIPPDAVVKALLKTLKDEDLLSFEDKRNIAFGMMTRSFFQYVSAKMGAM